MYGRARDALKMLIMPGGGTAISYFNTVSTSHNSALVERCTQSTDCPTGGETVRWRFIQASF